MGKFFELRGTLPYWQKIILQITGIILFFLIWHYATIITHASPGVFPPPLKVFAAFPELHFDDAVVRSAFYSIKLNLLGMLGAIILSIPLGFIIGLFPIFRALSEKQIAVFRYLPLTLLIGAFIGWFGFYDKMKIIFLAIGVFVYLLPTVIQRIDEVRDVYVQTVQTLGANKWQTIYTVFIPDVFSRVFDDIRNLVPISWTYIIIAEMINSTGGLGSLSYIASRQSRADKTFAILLILIIIGFLLDKIFSVLDKQFFPHKYATKEDK